MHIVQEHGIRPTFYAVHESADGVRSANRLR